MKRSLEAAFVGPSVVGVDSGLYRMDPRGGEPPKNEGVSAAQRP